MTKERASKCPIQYLPSPKDHISVAYWSIPEKIPLYFVQFCSCFSWRKAVMLGTIMAFVYLKNMNSAKYAILIA